MNVYPYGGVVDSSEGGDGPSSVSAGDYYLPVVDGPPEDVAEPVYPCP